MAVPTKTLVMFSKDGEIFVRAGVLLLGGVGLYFVNRLAMKRWRTPPTA